MRKYIALPAVSLLALALAACSTPPNANLEQARSNFSALQSQPDATKVAALETKDAGDWLAKADKAYQDGEDQRDVDQLAYLTNQRIELAKQTIVLRNAERSCRTPPPSAPRPASTRAPRNWTSCAAG